MIYNYTAVYEEICDDMSIWIINHPSTPLPHPKVIWHTMSITRSPSHSRSEILTHPAKILT